jgi:predicted  nucleic acid-binding Zn-ribbon protein
MKKLISVITIVTLLVSLSVSSFAAAAGTTASDTPAASGDIQKAIESNIAADGIKDAATAASEGKDDKIAKSDVKAFKGKLIDLYTELNKLRTECKDLWAQVRASNESIKSAWSSLKASLKDKDPEEAKKILAELKAKVEPVRAQVKALHADIQKLRESKKAEWVTLRAAIKERDEAKATAALNNIIDLKSQIIAKLKEILPLKKQILDMIK